MIWRIQADRDLPEFAKSIYSAYDFTLCQPLRTLPQRQATERLRRAVERVALRALADGALQPIATSVHHVTQRGVRFVVRRLAQVARPDTPRRMYGVSGRPQALRTPKIPSYPTIRRSL